MMRKVRCIAAIILCLLGIEGKSQSVSQYVHPGDTLFRKGFSNWREALDTVWNKLASRKQQTLLTYTMPDTLFYAETRKSRPEMQVQIMHGLWVGYWHKVNKSYTQTRKSLKKSKLSLNRVQRDTILITELGDKEEMMRVEQYFKKSATQWKLTFYLWQINGKWFLLEAIRIEQDDTRIR
jgi:hypothetical protein